MLPEFSHRFAQKMKRTIMAFALSSVLLHTAVCQEKTGMLGIELTSLLRSTAGISVSHNFSRHWSVTGEASVSYMSAIREKSTLEKEHDEEFVSSSSGLPAASDRQRIMAAFTYWPDSAYDGFYLSAGIQSGNCSGTDIITEAGYMLTIWKGLSFSAGLRIPLAESIRENRFSPKYVRAGIHYKF